MYPLALRIVAKDCAGLGQWFMIDKECNIVCFDFECGTPQQHLPLARIFGCYMDLMINNPVIQNFRWNFNSVDAVKVQRADKKWRALPTRVHVDVDDIFSLIRRPIQLPK
jgi:hypothetical protein